MRRKLFLSGMAVFVLLSPCFVGVVSADSSWWYGLYGDGWGTEAGSNVRECGHSLIATSDGGYAIAGQTDEFGAGGIDFWLVKFDAYGNMTWNQTYGGPQNDVAESLVETSDGGYALAGMMHNYLCFIKTDEYGVVPESHSFLIVSSLFTATLVIIIHKKKLFDDQP